MPIARGAVRNVPRAIAGNKGQSLVEKTDPYQTSPLEQAISKYIANSTKCKPMPTAARQRILAQLDKLKQELAQRENKH